MTPVTITLGEATTTFTTPLAAIRALLAELPNERLSGTFWLDLVRAEKLGRTQGLPGVQGAVGSNVVNSVR